MVPPAQFNCDQGSQTLMNLRHRTCTAMVASSGVVHPFSQDRNLASCRDCLHAQMSSSMRRQNEGTSVSCELNRAGTRYRKMVGAEQSPTRTAEANNMHLSRRDKLMSDASLSFELTKKRYCTGELRAMGNTAYHASAAARTAEKSMASFTAIKHIKFDDIVISDRLRTTLIDLGALTPICVFKKKMTCSDRSIYQNRLLMPYMDNNKERKGVRGNKRKKSSNGDGNIDQIPFAKIFTRKEMPIVHRAEQQESDNRGKNEVKDKLNITKCGLDVQAYDRDGQPYHLNCKFLSSNVAYRIIGKDWRKFLRNNGLIVAEKKPRKDKKPHKDKKVLPEAEGSEGQSSSPAKQPNDEHKKQKIDNVCIEVWAFRSRKLKLGLTQQTDGALGLVLLHYHEGRDEHVGISPAASEEVQGAASEDPVVAVPIVVDAAGGQEEASQPVVDVTPKEFEVAEALLLLSTRGCN